MFACKDAAGLQFKRLFRELTSKDFMWMVSTKSYDIEGGLFKDVSSKKCFKALFIKDIHKQYLFSYSPPLVL